MHFSPEVQKRLERVAKLAFVSAAVGYSAIRISRLDRFRDFHIIVHDASKGFTGGIVNHARDTKKYLNTFSGILKSPGDPYALNEQELRLSVDEINVTSEELSELEEAVETLMARKDNTLQNG